MIISSLHVEKLHGYITGETKLNRELSILFGKNGSGKTTALNIIRAVLSFDISYIEKLQFSKIAVRYIDNNEQREIEISKANEKTTIKIGELSADTSSLSVILSKDEESFVVRSFLGAGAGRKSKQITELSALKGEIENIKSRANVTLVNIDRTIKVTESSGDVAIDTSWMVAKFILESNTPQKTKEKDPLEVVQSYCTRNHQDYQKDLATIKTKFINNLMVKFLDLRSEELTKDTRRLSVEDIERLEKRLRELDIYSTSTSESVLGKFFKDTRRILSTSINTTKRTGKAGRRTAKEERDIIIKNISFARVESLLTSLQEMDREIEHCSQKIEKYLRVVNSFFETSEKELFFSKTNSQLRFRFTNQPKTNTTDGRNINELSSGERQIIIVLTYLYFIAKENSIFVIDEPELSLHLAWQSMFVGAMLELSPTNCQIILASHSPEIIGPYRYAVERVFGHKDANLRNADEK